MVAGTACGLGQKEPHMAGNNSWASWSLTTKLTVGVGLALAVALVAGFNIFA
jgi:hypothetical protein